MCFSLSFSHPLSHSLLRALPRSFASSFCVRVSGEVSLYFKVNRSLSGNLLITMPRKALRSWINRLFTCHLFAAARRAVPTDMACREMRARSEINYRAESPSRDYTGNWSMSKWLLVVVVFSSSSYFTTL